MVVALDIGLLSTFSECRIEGLMLTVEFSDISEALGSGVGRGETAYTFAHGEMHRQYGREKSKNRVLLFMLLWPPHLLPRANCKCLCGGGRPSRRFYHGLYLCHLPSIDACFFQSHMTWCLKRGCLVFQGRIWKLFTELTSLFSPNVSILGIFLEVSARA